MTSCACRKTWIENFKIITNYYYKSPLFFLTVFQGQVHHCMRLLCFLKSVMFGLAETDKIIMGRETAFVKYDIFLVLEKFHPGHNVCRIKNNDLNVQDYL